MKYGYILISLLNLYDMLFYSPPTLIPCKEYVPFFVQSFQAISYKFMEVGYMLPLLTQEEYPNLSLFHCLVTPFLWLDSFDMRHDIMLLYCHRFQELKVSGAFKPMWIKLEIWRGFACWVFIFKMFTKRSILLFGR